MEKVDQNSDEASQADQSRASTKDLSERTSGDCEDGNAGQGEAIF